MDNENLARLMDRPGFPDKYQNLNINTNASHGRHLPYLQHTIQLSTFRLLVQRPLARARWIGYKTDRIIVPEQRDPPKMSTTNLASIMLMIPETKGKTLGDIEGEVLYGGDLVVE